MAPFGVLAVLVVASAAADATNYVGYMKVRGSGSGTNTVTVTGLDMWDGPERRQQTVSSQVVSAPTNGTFMVYTSGMDTNLQYLRAGTYDVNVQNGNSTSTYGYTNHTTWNDPGGDCATWTLDGNTKKVGTVTYYLGSDGVIDSARDVLGNAITVSSGWAGPFSLPVGMNASPGSYEQAVCISSPNAVNGNQAPLDIIGGPTDDITGIDKSDIDVLNPYRNTTSCHAAQNVNCATGNFWQSFEDVSVPGRGAPLDLTRTFSAGRAALDGPLGRGWTHSYAMHLGFDVAGNITVHADNGATVGFTRLPTGAYLAEPGVLATLVANPDGTLTFTGHRQQLRHRFSATGRLLDQRDANNEATVLGYVGAQLSTVTEPAGRTLSFTYTAGKLTGVADSTGRSLSFTYDASGDLVSATDVGGAVTTFAYDPQHRIVATKDSKCSATPGCLGVRNTYQLLSGRVASQTDALGRTTTFSYATGTTTVVHPEGNTERQFYDDHKLISLTEGLGTPQAATWAYTYDPATLGLTTMTDPNGHTTTATYDERGNLLSSTDPLGRTTAWTYSSANRPTTATGPDGVTTTATYDAAANLTSVSRPLVGTTQAAKTTLAYADPAHPGDITSLTDAKAKTWSFAYNANGDRTAATDPLGNATTSCYDARGHLVSTTAPKGSNPSCGTGAAFTTYVVNNAFGDLTSITDALSHATTYGYDANRNPTTVTDALSHTTTTTYDLEDQSTKVARHDGSEHTTAYDDNGNVVAQTDPLNHATTHAYDALDRRTSTTDPLGRTAAFTYDPAGNRVATTDASGNVAAMAYDPADQLVGLAYSDPTTPNVSFTYDLNGDRASMADGTGTSTYVHDSLGRLVSATDGAGRRVGYGYDLVDNLVSITYPIEAGQPAPRVATRTYDHAGRLTKVGDWANNEVVFAWDPNSNLITQTAKAAGTTVGSDTYSFDAADNTMGVVATTSSAGTVHSLTYGRDATDKLSSEGTKAFGYDTIDRLTSEGPASFGYDAADRITALRGATQSYDPADQLTSAGTTAFSHDARGNRVAKGSTAYAYDQANRLTKAAGTTSYSYNGDGLRMAKAPLVAGVPSPAATSFAWDHSGELPLLLEETTPGTGTTTYLYGPHDLPTHQISASGQVSFFHHDQLGSTRALTDTTGAVVATATYDAYGKPTATTGTQSALGFAGQYTDAETGFQYLRARCYDPATGQFLTRDPIAEATGQPYAYAEDNPLNLVDRNGLWPVPADGGAASGNAGGQSTRVGRWMSWVEFNSMRSTARVVEGAGGRTYVVRPPNPKAYTPTIRGSVYAEFDVPTSSLRPASKPEWAVIPGPNVTTTRYGPPPEKMPPAKRIRLVCRSRK